MQRVMNEIEQRTAAFATAKLFDFLRDTTIDPRERLAFAPSVAHFVMSFADLYTLVLRDEPAQDAYQELVNAHTHEDSNHWRWFLADLQKLGHEPTTSLGEVLKLLWGDATVKMRMLSYHMCKLGMGADSLRKLVLVHCIEATGKVTIEHVSRAGREFSALTGKSLVYFGPHHFDTESDHTLEDGDVHARLAAVVLDDARAQELTALVEESFAHFTAFVDELLVIATSERRRMARGHEDDPPRGLHAVSPS
jgi:hypothetical protein